MRIVSIALALSVLPVASIAMAEAAAPVTAPAPYSINRTPLGKLMADPAAKAVLIKHIPMLGQKRDDMPGGDVSEQAAGMTIKELADATRAYTGDMFSDAVLAAIEGDLAKLAPAK